VTFTVEDGTETVPLVLGIRGWGSGSIYAYICVKY